MRDEDPAHPVTRRLRHQARGAPTPACMYVNCCQGGHGRQYYTRDEKKAYLEDYASELENELKAVRERIQEIGKET